MSDNWCTSPNCQRTTGGCPICDSETQQMTPETPNKYVERARGIMGDITPRNIGKTALAQALKDTANAATAAERKRYSGVIRQLSKEGYISSVIAESIIGACTFEDITDG